MTPPGWYRDPYGDPGLLRWWDGGQWTQTTRPLGEDPQTGQVEGNPDPPGPATQAEETPDRPEGQAEGSPAGPEARAEGTPAGPEARAEGAPAGPATQAWGGPGAAGPETQAWEGPGGAGPAAPAWGAPAPAWPEAGPGTAPAWPGSGPGAAPAWQGASPGGAAGWQGVGPGAAPGWPGAGPGQAAPPPWTQPGPQTRRSRLPLLIGGGAAAVIIITVVVVLLATNVFGGGDDKTGRSPVVATITDAQAGISYPRLGGAWRTETVTATGGLGKLGFDQGETAQVMADFQNGEPYVASAYSGVSTDISTDPLQTKARTVFAALEPGSYPAHTRQELASESHPVDGHDGWLLKVRLTFPQAASQHWNFRTETAALVLVDRGNGQAPAEFYVSIPDSHKRQGDLDLLLTSLKVS